MSDIRRREFIILLGTAAAAWPRTPYAQQPDRVRRVGVLMGIADDLEGQARIAVFRQALQALGWSEGRNVQFIYRWSGGDVAHARQFDTDRCRGQGNHPHDAYGICTGQ
jgi:putative ABC transport system substrate-binding protein